MNIFVAASYSSQINYETGEVFSNYKLWLEENLTTIEKLGHTVFCALRADGYRINDSDPAKAFSLDETQIESADGMLAFVTNTVSAGVQTEVGMALAKGKQLVLAHSLEDQLAYFNRAIVLAGLAKELILPISSDPFAVE